MSELGFISEILPAANTIVLLTLLNTGVLSILLFRQFTASRKADAHVCCVETRVAELHSRNEAGASAMAALPEDYQTCRIVRQGMQAMGMACMIIDSTLTVVDANQAICTRLGYIPADLVGRKMSSILPEHVQSDYALRLERLLACSGFLQPCTLTVLDSRENVISLPVLMSRARFNDSWFLCMFVVMPDMLDRLCDLRDNRIIPS